MCVGAIISANSFAFFLIYFFAITQACTQPDEATELNNIGPRTLSIKHVPSRKNTITITTTNTKFERCSKSMREQSTFVEDSSSLATSATFDYFTKNLYVNMIIKKMEHFLLTVVLILIMMNMHFLFLLEITLKVDSDVEAAKAEKEANTVENYLTRSVVTPQTNVTAKTSLTGLTSSSNNYSTSLECTPDNNFYYSFFLRYVWFWLDMVVYFVIPLFTMSISFLFIRVKLRRTNENYSFYLASENSKCNAKIWLKRIKKNRQILVKLLLVNSYFFFSSLPYYVYNFLIDYPKQNYYLLTLFNILFYSNNACSFFLYGISSQQYRKEMFNIIWCTSSTAQARAESTMCRPRESTTNGR